MYLTNDNEYVAFLDACVLVPMATCDLLLRLAEEPALYQIRWSEPVLAELERALAKRNRYTPSQIERRLAAMRTSFPEAEVVGFDSIRVPNLPDPGDEHVIAAAVAGQCSAIVTSNLADFPQALLADLGLVAQSPDEFLCHQFTLSAELVQVKIDDLSAALNWSRDEYLRRLHSFTPRFADAVKKR